MSISQNVLYNCTRLGEGLLTEHLVFIHSFHHCNLLSNSSPNTIEKVEEIGAFSNRMFLQRGKKVSLRSFLKRSRPKGIISISKLNAKQLSVLLAGEVKVFC